MSISDRHDSGWLLQEAATDTGGQGWRQGALRVGGRGFVHLSCTNPNVTGTVHRSPASPSHSARPCTPSAVAMVMSTTVASLLGCISHWTDSLGSRGPQDATGLTVSSRHPFGCVSRSTGGTLRPGANPSGESVAKAPSMIRRSDASCSLDRIRMKTKNCRSPISGDSGVILASNTGARNLIASSLATASCADWAPYVRAAYTNAPIAATARTHVATAVIALETPMLIPANVLLGRVAEVVQSEVRGCSGSRPGWAIPPTGAREGSRRRRDGLSCSPRHR